MMILGIIAGLGFAGLAFSWCLCLIMADADQRMRAKTPKERT